MNNPKTVFITGCSSGIGAALAQLIQLMPLSLPELLHSH